MHMYGEYVCVYCMLSFYLHVKLTYFLGNFLLLALCAVNNFESCCWLSYLLLPFFLLTGVVVFFLAGTIQILIAVFFFVANKC